MPSGGARPNGGRKPGGITHARRILLSAIQRGLARAARDRGLDRLTGTDDEAELALECASRIAADMVLAGQGRDVLALWAQMAPKDAEADNQPSGGLSDALRRLPGASQPTFSAPVSGRILDAEGQDESLHDDTSSGMPYESVGNDEVPTDSASVGTENSADAQPFFLPQQLLPGVVPLAQSSARSKHPPVLSLREASLLPGGYRGERACVVELDGVAVEIAPARVERFKALRDDDRAQRVSQRAGEVAGPPTPPPPPL